MCSEPGKGTYSECKVDNFGMEYHGKMSYTWDNHTCLPWALFSMTYSSSQFPDNSIDEASNYCRNPNHKTFGPYCIYHCDKQGCLKELCPIKICGMSDEINVKYLSLDSHTHMWHNITKTFFRDTADVLQQFIIPIILLVGTVFNALSIYVFTHETLRKSTTSLLLPTLTATDLLSLYTNALEQCLSSFTGMFLAASSDVSCKICKYIQYLVSAASGWVIIVVTWERLINIAVPFQAQSICSKKNVCILLVI